MPVKYKGILKIIFGIYTHCQQIGLSVDNEYKCQTPSILHCPISFV